MWKKLREVIEKYWEILSYLFFGGCTTVVSIVTYSLFVGPLSMPLVPGKILSWFCSVVFAFVTNKLWVFRSKAMDAKTLLREGGEFFGSRIATGVAEVVGLPLLIKLGLDQTLFGVEGFVANVVVTVVVIILNYILSKFIVFRKKKTEE